MKKIIALFFTLSLYFTQKKIKKVITINKILDQPPKRLRIALLCQDYQSYQHYQNLALRTSPPTDPNNLFALEPSESTPSESQPAKNKKGENTSKSRQKAIINVQYYSNTIAITVDRLTNLQQMLRQRDMLKSSI